MLLGSMASYLWLGSKYVGLFTGGQNKGIAQLHSFAAIDSTLTSSTTASRSHGYDLMGTQRIDVINADSQRSVIPVAVQDSAESYDARYGIVCPDTSHPTTLFCRPLPDGLYHRCCEVSRQFRLP